MNVAFISRPNIDVATFAKVATQYLGTNPMTAVTQSSRQHSPDAEFLATAMAFKGEDDNAVECIRNSEAVQYALAYTLLAFASYEASRVIAGMGLRIRGTTVEQRNTTLSIFAGTLQDWQEAVIAGTNSSDSEVRHIFDCIYLLFEGIGLADIWFGYRQVANPDRTFRLTQQ